MAEPFTVERDSQAIAGEASGEGPAVVLLHGLTASRRYVVHGSRTLERKGFRVLAYDARGHGESGPAPPGTGYGYEEMAADFGAVIEREVGGNEFVAVGHSMGAHTTVSWALEHQGELSGLVVIGPVYNGVPYDDDVIERWDELADGMEADGVEGFLRVYERGDLHPDWRDVVLRITRDRLAAHRHPEAVAEALREVPRSIPFESLAELEFLEVPALVVASFDDADPGHPHAVAEAWAERLPQARLVSEQAGESPLAWQGGRLSREIAAFCEEPPVVERHRQ